MKIALDCKKILFLLFSFGLITMLMIPNLALAVDAENSARKQYSTKMERPYYV